jgi:predicted phage terminase large subunit-like protein
MTARTEMLSLLEAKAKRTEREDLEQSLSCFLKSAWPYIDPAPWMHGWPIEAVAQHLEAVVDGELKRLIINIPPRCAKSSLCSVAFPAWVWAQPIDGPTSGPSVPFLSASYDLRLSLRDNTKCRRLIESPWYQGLWGDRVQLNSDQNTKSRFSNTAKGERLITSIGAGVTGEGGNIILIDDPNAANEVKPEAAAIQETIDWWETTMSSRLNNPKTGAFVIIQQRLAENDLTGHILEKEADGWCHLVLPMRYEPDRSFYTPIGWKDPRTEEGELLWPERFGEEQVQEAERRMGPFTAAGQLQQRPEPAGGGVIKRDWWKLWEEDAFPPMDYIIAYLDTAYTEKTMNDPSAMVVLGVYSAQTQAVSTRAVLPDGRINYDERSYIEGAPKVMMMYAWTERLELHQLVHQAAQTAKRFKVDKLIIENKAAGISVAQELRRLYAGEDFTVVLNDPKSADKLSRLYSVQHLFAEGMIWAPDRAWADKVITQVGQFPAGKHDDLVDCVSGGLRHLRDLGLLVRSPERLQEIEDAKRFMGRPSAPLYDV